MQSEERGSPSPTKEEVLAARLAAKMTQDQAASLVHLSSFTRWSEYERDVRQMDPARYELFLIKTNQHPMYGPRVRARRTTAS